MLRTLSRSLPRTLPRTLPRMLACALSGLLAGTLLGGGLVAAPATATAADTAADAASAPAGEAADSSRWLVSQLDNDRIRNVAFAFDDWGLTIDTYLALVATGVRPVRAQRVIETVSDNALEYVQFDDVFFAGAVAKLLLARRVAGMRGTVHSIDLDLRDQLLSQVRPSGRVSDSGGDDFSSTLTQSLAVIALARSGKVPQQVVDYLLRQQCREGYFREQLAFERCTPAGGKAYVDSTAIAAQALLAALKDGAVVPARATDTVATWLDDAQLRGGGFAAVEGSPANANTTGLAAQALSALGHGAGVRAARGWVEDLQLTPDRAGGGPAAADVGAIALDRPTLRAALEDGITDTTRDTWRRSTPQAQFALRSVSLGELSLES